MSEKSSNNGLKVAVVLLSLLVLGAGGYGYAMYKSNQETVSVLENDKSAALDELNEMSLRLDSAISENTVTNSNLENAKAEIEELINELKNAKANIRSLSAYKRKFRALQKRMTNVLRKNDSLQVENQKLATVLDSTNVAKAELEVKASELTTTISNAAVLNMTSLKGEGVIVRSSGREIITEKARRSDILKICFTVPKNPLVEAGDKTFYVQVIDPKSNVLGDNAKIDFPTESLNYSVATTFNYAQKNIDICERISIERKAKFEKGLYKINVYEGERLVSNSVFTLE